MKKSRIDVCYPNAQRAVIRNSKIHGSLYPRRLVPNAAQPEQSRLPKSTQGTRNEIPDTLCPLLSLPILSLIKSALGIDLIPGSFRGSRSWFKSAVL